MTATQRVFETITVDIDTQSFHNVYQTLCDKRDMSQSSLKELWRQKFLNQPLEDGQTVRARVNIMILDVLYIADENYEVFDSAKQDFFKLEQLSIKELLQQRGILEIVQGCKELSLEFSVFLTIDNGQEGDGENLKLEEEQKHAELNDTDTTEKAKSGPTMMTKLRDIIKTKVIESHKDEDTYEPGSPTNFTFSTIGRLTMRRAGAHRGGVYRKNNSMPSN